jgi:hypothetical protein
MMARPGHDRSESHQPNYETPESTKYDKPSDHRSIADVVDAPCYRGAGAYAIGEKVHIPTEHYAPRDTGVFNALYGKTGRSK